MTDFDFSNFYKNGIEILDSVLSESEVDKLISKLTTIQNYQSKEFKKFDLQKIGENNMVRSPIIYDNYFRILLDNKKIISILERLLGSHFILSLMNGIIIPPNKDHHQSFYHRDIIHQTFTSSRPIGVNVYFCLTDFSKKNGGTVFLRGSHELEELKINNEFVPQVKKGSVIFFNSMIFHKAGVNNSSSFRHGINTMYTLPFIKQQFSYYRLIKNDDSLIKDEYLKRIFGFNSMEFNNVEEFLYYRINKLNRNV